MMQRYLLMSLSSLPTTFVDAIYPVGAIFQTTSDINPNDYFGGGAAHNNMPPYYVVHIWHRVS